MDYSNIIKKLSDIRNRKSFETVVISVIVLSAVAVGVKTHDVSGWLVDILPILDIVVTLFFVFEIFIRIIVEKKPIYFFKSGWNIFDFIIVLVSLMPIGNSEMVLLGRLLRIFRVLRLISFIPELKVLIDTLIKTIPRMGYVVLLMFIVFYIYAAFGSIFFHNINPGLWGDISISLLTLFRIVTFEDWTSVMYETMAIYPFSWIYYLSFIFLAAFVFLNMMIGVIIDVFLEENRECGNTEVKSKNNKFDTALAEVSVKLDKIEKLLTKSD